MGVRKTLLKNYIVSWYGPFHDVEELKEWEFSQRLNFCLYLLQGKQKNARNYSYYCGQTKRNVFERFKDKYHRINQIPNHLNIWIGTFDNRFKTEDINIAENMFIYLLSVGISETQLLNERSLYLKSQNSVCLICKWYNPKLYRQPEYSLKLILPEVTVYFADTDEIKVSKKLRSL